MPLVVAEVVHHQEVAISDVTLLLSQRPRRRPSLPSRSVPHQDSSFPFQELLVRLPLVVTAQKARRVRRNRPRQLASEITALKAVSTSVVDAVAPMGGVKVWQLVLTTDQTQPLVVEAHFNSHHLRPQMNLGQTARVLISSDDPVPQTATLGTRPGTSTVTGGTSLQPQVSKTSSRPQWATLAKISRAASSQVTGPEAP